MPNNLDLLRADLAKREEEIKEHNDFIETKPLTEDERRVLEDGAGDLSVMMEEVRSTGETSSIPIEEYAAPVDKRVRQVAVQVGDGEETLKMVNGGDISKTAEDMMREAREKAIGAYKTFAVGNSEVSDDDIMAINTEAIEAVKAHLGTERITADDITRKLSKMPMQALIGILPQSFVGTYTTQGEIRAMNTKAKERLIATLAYVAAIGPEFDYLNEYVNQEERLIAVSKRLLECQISFADMLKSPEKISEIAARAKDIVPEDQSIWAKYINNDSQRVHNEFAQTSVIYDEYAKAYAKLLDDYPGEENARAREMIQEQIDESRTKQQVYLNVLELTTLRQCWSTMETWLKGDRRASYDHLEAEGIAAIERMRRSKQEIPFPTYDPKLAKRPELLYRNYLEKFSSMIKNYNSALYKVLLGETDEAAKAELERDDVQPIGIEGRFEDTVANYFGLLLLICYGRILKKLTASTATKYDAIALNAYFQCYCKLATDIHLMNDVWTIARPLVDYAIANWPRQSKAKKGKR